MRTALSVSTALIVGAAASGCSNELPPHGQVHVVVDTDLPAPRFASRLRVDLFDEGGRWRDSLDFPRPEGSAWPTSFTLWSDVARERLVLVRLRAYPEGKVRPYRGERFAKRPVFVEPSTASSQAELCSSPPEIELGRALSLRRGSVPILPAFSGGECSGLPMQQGSVAAYFDVPTMDDYRVAVVATFGDMSQVMMSVRRQCDEPSDQLACANGITEVPTGSSGPFDHPDVTLTLEPGRYYVVTGGTAGPGYAADVVLGVARAADFDGLLPPEVSMEEEPPREPVVEPGGSTATPDEEPEPRLTVDRLVLVRVEPDVERTVRVTLHGACVGTMVMLGADPPHQRPDATSAATCVDAENVRAPLSLATAVTDVEARSPSQQGSFGAASPCPDADDPAGSVACVPGGLLALGREGSAGDVPATPERLVGLSTFWMDRYEVTVARFREALASGLSLAASDMPSPQDATSSYGKHCRWRPSPGGNEDHALSCIPWSGARAYCLFRGGDLPTEAQWEHAAGGAGRPFETRYPWGDDQPRCVCPDPVHPDEPCHAAAVDRWDFSADNPDSGFLPVGACVAPLGGLHAPGAVTEHDDPTMGDVAMLPSGAQLVGLAGGLAEWTLDAFHRYDDACWDATTVLDPTCIEQDPPRHTVRGGSWKLSARFGESSSRKTVLDNPRFENDVGFRCVYPVEPSP